MHAPDPIVKIPWIVVVLDREAIEAGRTEGPLDMLRKLSESRASTLAWQEKLILAVSGYDDDPRELGEIAAVREYIAALNKVWPYWLWFLRRQYGQIALLESLLAKLHEVRRRGDGRIIFDMDTDSQAELWHALRSRTEIGLGAMGIDPEQIKASVASAENEPVRLQHDQEDA